LPSGYLLREWLKPSESGLIGVRDTNVRIAIADLVKLLEPDWVEQKIAKHLSWKERYSLNVDNLILHRDPSTNPIIADLAVAESIFHRLSCPNRRPKSKYRQTGS